MGTTSVITERKIISVLELIQVALKLVPRLTLPLPLGKSESQTEMSHIQFQIIIIIITINIILTFPYLAVWIENDPAREQGVEPGA